MSSNMSLLSALSWPIEGVDVPVQCVPASDLGEGGAWAYWPIIAPEFYGILRRRTQIIQFITVTCSDPVYVILHCKDGFEQYRLSLSEMQLFLTHYCGLVKDKPNWKEEGF